MAQAVKLLKTHLQVPQHRLFDIIHEVDDDEAAKVASGRKKLRTIMNYTPKSCLVYNPY